MSTESTSAPRICATEDLAAELGVEERKLLVEIARDPRLAEPENDDDDLDSSLFSQAGGAIFDILRGEFTGETRYGKLLESINREAAASVEEPDFADIAQNFYDEGLERRMRNFRITLEKILTETWAGAVGSLSIRIESNPAGLTAFFNEESELTVFSRTEFFRDSCRADDVKVHPGMARTLLGLDEAQRTDLRARLQAVAARAE